MPWKQILIVTGVLGTTGTLAFFAGRQRRSDAPMEPTFEPPGSPTPLDATEIEVFGQGLLRMAMNKKVLDDATMARLIGLAQKAQLPKMAALLMQSKAEGKLKGSSADELFPGSTMNIREWISHRLKQLQAGVA